MSNFIFSEEFHGISGLLGEVNGHLLSCGIFIRVAFTHQPSVGLAHFCSRGCDGYPKKLVGVEIRAVP
jgi:hypothetical protein